MAKSVIGTLSRAGKDTAASSITGARGWPDSLSPRRRRPIRVRLRLVFRVRERQKVAILRPFEGVWAMTRIVQHVHFRIAPSGKRARKSLRGETATLTTCRGASREQPIRPLVVSLTAVDRVGRR